MVTMETKRRRNGDGDRSSRMLRTGEACRILCVHSNTLRRWCELGIIRAYRIGPRGDRRFKLEDVTELLAENIRFNSTVTREPK